MKLTREIIEQNKEFLASMSDAVVNHMNLLRWKHGVICDGGDEARYSLQVRGDDTNTLVIQSSYLDRYDDMHTTEIYIADLLSAADRLEAFYAEQKKEDERRKARARAQRAREKKRKEELKSKEAMKDRAVFDALKKQYGWS